MLLYGIKIWVVTDTMMKGMEGFHHRISRQITRMTAWRRAVMEWDWASVEEALEVAVLWPMK